MKLEHGFAVRRGKGVRNIFFASKRTRSVFLKSFAFGDCVLCSSKRRRFELHRTLRIFFSRTGNRLIDRLATNFYEKSYTKRRCAGYIGGEVKALLINLGSEPFAIERGMRICQLVPAAVTRAALTIVASLDDTERGAGGFGSTGT